MSTLRQKLTPTRGKMVINSPLLEQNSIISENQKKLRKSIIWGTINTCLLAIFLYDVLHTSPIYIASILYFEYTLITVFTLNIIYHMICYINVSLKDRSLASVLQQNQRLSSPENDKTRRLSYSPNSTLTYGNIPNVLASTPMNTSAISWRSHTSFGSHNSKISPPPSPNMLNSSQYLSNESPLKTYYDSSGCNMISDTQSLSEYLKGYETFEKLNNSVVEQPTSLLSSFWNHPAAKINNNTPPTLAKHHYQLSPVSASSSSSSPNNELDVKLLPNNVNISGMEMWNRFHVNNITLTQWNANLRCWLSQTVVERLENEFDYINDAFKKQGILDIKIGSVGLDRLRKTAQMPQTLQFVPTLSTLLPFLEITTNQEYLVKRIRDLAKGGCMSEFKWNGGCDFNGKEWNCSLPTDSAIIMHLFATYLDTQLLPLPNQPDVKPFSGHHYIKLNEKVPKLTPNTLAIQHWCDNPPHYRVIIGEEVFEMIQGYNNLFQSILLFLHQANQREQGILGRINLGRSGVNILWVIDN